MLPATNVVSLIRALVNAITLEALDGSYDGGEILYYLHVKNERTVFEVFNYLYIKNKKNVFETETGAAQSIC